MVNKLLAAATALILVGIALVAAPFYTGYKMEQGFRQAAREFAKTGVLEIYLLRYERGYYSSRALTRLQVPGSGGEPLTLDLQHRIVHGFGLGGFNYGKVTTTLAADTPLAIAAAGYFGQQPPLRVVTVFGLSGGVSGSLFSPPVNGRAGQAVPGAAVQWLGLSGEYEVNRSSGMMQLGLPGLVASGGGTEQVALRDVRLDVDMYKGEDSGTWLGKSESSIGSLAFDAPGRNLRLERMSLSGESSEQSGSVSMSFSYGVGRFSAADVEVNDLALRISLGNLDAVALKAWSEAIDQASAASEEQQMALMMQSMQLLPKLLSRRPVFTIEEARLQFNGAPVELGGSLRYVGDAAQGFNPMADIEGEFSLQAPRAMLIEILAHRGGAPASVGDPALDAASAAETRMLAAQTVQQYLDQGLLVANNDATCRAVVRLGSGGITVNGLPLTAFQSN